MATKTAQTNTTKESLLSRFHLDYELDKTWKEAKKDIRVRTER